MFSGPPLLTLRLGLVLVCALPAIVVLAPTPALADLRVCNQTANEISIALGYRAENGWQSEGWWVAPPSQCATIYQGALNSRFFYVFAADDIGGGSWEGQVYMCTRDESFTIFGVGDCLARGHERTGFFEVDTQNRSDWMLQLTEGGPGAGTVEGADQTVPLNEPNIIPLDGVEEPPLDGDPDAPLDGAEESVESQ